MRTSPEDWAAAHLEDVPFADEPKGRGKPNGKGASARPANGSGGAAEPAAERGPPPPRFSDDALALMFAERHADGVRYVAQWGQWLSWTGTRWQADSTLRAFDLARAIAREIAATCKQKKTAISLASAKTVAAVERLAKADRRLAATDDQWDARSTVLNTPTTGG